jgi:epoxyqueuosine reductase
MDWLLERLTECGYRGGLVSIRHLPELQEEIEGRYRQGLLDPELHRTYLASYDFRPPQSLPAAHSVIVVAVPQPQTRLLFQWRGQTLPVTIPPTYMERTTNEAVRRTLQEPLDPRGQRVVRARLPEKLLAARSGLASYGRNNITYVPGMGSFHDLVVFFSDVSADEDSWQEPQMLERCHDCEACRRRCPTGAIDPERFLLHAERCITFHNEKPSAVAFPRWIDPSWHNALVGCLHCQLVCPENKEVRQWTVEGPEFAEEETALLLQDIPVAQIPPPTLAKLAAVEMDGYADALARNLKVLLPS